MAAVSEICAADYPQLRKNTTHTKGRPDAARRPAFSWRGTSAFGRHLLAVLPIPANLPAVNRFLSRPLLPVLCLALGPGLFAAAEKSPAPAPVAAKPAAPAEVLELPKIQVTAERVKKIDKDIKRLDKMIARETAKVKSSDLDKALNNDKLARAAAIFGGNSAEHLSAVAATRVALLQNERDVMEAMKRPTTLDELAMMEKEIEQLRETRRNLDDAAKQR
jgi:hypothetical protein